LASWFNWPWRKGDRKLSPFSPVCPYPNSPWWCLLFPVP